MIENLPILISSVCGFLLICLVMALIFSSRFRDDVLGGEGEATVAGVLSVKGVAIVLLCALFLGGFIYPLAKSPVHEQELTNCRVEINNIIASLSTYSEELTPLQTVRLANQKIDSLTAKNIQLNANILSCNTSLEGKKIDFNLLTNKLSESENKFNQCNTNLESNKAVLKNCIERDRGVLAILNLIQDDIQKFSPAIDFSYIPDDKKKRDAAYRVLDVLGRLGWYDQAPSRNPDAARKALIQFQISKNILPPNPNKQGLLGRKTFLILLADYIVGEENGG